MDLDDDEGDCKLGGVTTMEQDHGQLRWILKIASSLYKKGTKVEKTMSNIIEQILHTTLRIECFDENKIAISVGTGFCYNDL